MPLLLDFYEVSATKYCTQMGLMVPSFEIAYRKQYDKVEINKYIGQYEAA